MKLDNLVSFRVGRDKQVAFGVLVQINLTKQGLICTISRQGIKYVRNVRFVKSVDTGKGEVVKKIRKKLKRHS